MPTLPEIDPAQIADPAVRQIVLRLLNLVETLHAEAERLRAENQRLRDELARLQGGSGRPTFPAPRRSVTDYSSEQERRAPRPARPPRESAPIDRTESLAVERDRLPPDAVFKGYASVVVRDLVIRAETVCFVRERWYSPATRQTYLAPLPPGYSGRIGPGVRTLALTLAHGGLMSQANVRAVVGGLGVPVSAGWLAGLLGDEAGRFRTEAQAVGAAGLASSPWQHLDDTGTRVNGGNHHCHVVANPLYTAYTTTPRKDRLTARDVLHPGQPRRYLYDAAAAASLAAAALPAAARRALTHLPPDRALDEAAMARWFAAHLPRVGQQARQVIAEALVLAADRACRDGPGVQLLVTDEAPQFAGVTAERALCWVHLGRAIRQLTPQAPCFQTAQTELLDRFWRYYRELQAYSAQPRAAEAARLATGFDALFGTETGYAGLDKLLARARAAKDEFLAVLRHPEVPLHNNPAELGARRRVRKRDVSFGPRTAGGTQAWDTFQTLAATTAKLGVSFVDYIRDRVTGAQAVPPLADLIRQRAAALNLGASWNPPALTPDQ